MSTNLKQYPASSMEGKKTNNKATVLGPLTVVDWLLMKSQTVYRSYNCYIYIMPFITVGWDIANCRLN
jgi:hypothetical protein